jgi:disulfide bond formation protein DsbB
MTNLAKANWLAFTVPLALLGGALGFQYIGGYPPCEMCHWQRWPHAVALALALLALFSRGHMSRRPLVLLAAIAIAISGLIGVYHAGVELHWWQGATACTAKPIIGDADAMLEQILAAPLTRCDEIPWSLLGISMAGWNAIISLGSAGAILWLTIRRPA